MSILYISLLIGFLALDTTIALQILISQPIFSCSLIGAVLGDFSTGVEIGMMMQLLWLNVVPAGATRFPEGNVAAMVIAAGVILFQQPLFPNSIFAVIFFLGILVSLAGMKVTFWQRRSNDMIFRGVLEAIDNSRPSRIVQLNAAGIFSYFAAMTMLALFSLLIMGSAVGLMSETFSAKTEHFTRFLKPGIWAIGLALVGRMMYKDILKKA